MSEWLERLRGLVTVEPVMFFFMTGTFIVMPAYQQLIIAKVCHEIYGDSSICSNPQHYNEDEEVQKQSSYILLMFTATLSVVSIPPAILLGSWSDRAGRKFGMILPCLLSLVSGSIYIAMSQVKSMNAYWSIVSALVTGLSGNHVSIFLSCFSYVADVTDSGSRTLRMGINESMIYLGGAVGFLFSGFLLPNVGLTATFGAFCACQILSLLYVLLWVRDPKPAATDLRLPGEEALEAAYEIKTKPRLSILMYAKLSFRILTKRRPGQERQKLYFLILCTFLNNTIAMGDQAITLLFLMYEPREFTTELYGVFNSAKMTLLGFSLLGLFPLLLRCMGQNTLAKISTIFKGVSYGVLAFSTKTWMVFLVAVIGAPGGISQAVIRSLCSAIVEPGEQGAMFSVCASVEAACILIGGAIFNSLYPQTLATFPGMPFIVMAAFSFIVLIFLQWISEMPATQPRLVIQD